MKGTTHLIIACWLRQLQTLSADESTVIFFPNGIHAGAPSDPSWGLVDLSFVNWANFWLTSHLSYSASTRPPSTFIDPVSSRRNPFDTETLQKVTNFAQPHVNYKQTLIINSFHFWMRHHNNLLFLHFLNVRTFSKNLLKILIYRRLRIEPSTDHRRP